MRVSIELPEKLKIELKSLRKQNVGLTLANIVAHNKEKCASPPRVNRNFIFMGLETMWFALFCCFS